MLLERELLCILSCCTFDDKRCGCILCDLVAIDLDVVRLAAVRLTAGLHVTFHMQRQMIGAREAAITVATFKRFGAGVLAIMTRQFVTARESPFAALPGAFIWFFT